MKYLLLFLIIILFTGLQLSEACELTEVTLNEMEKKETETKTLNAL